MVVHHVPGLRRGRNATDEGELDRILSALADRTRRDILRRAMQSETSVSDLARRYPMSLPAVQKHVAVLERAGLVRKQRQGRICVVRPEPAAMHPVHQLLDGLERLWRDRVSRMADLVRHEGAAGHQQGA
jgi:DNA-binding transcriptional ArsR family regulator